MEWPTKLSKWHGRKGKEEITTIEEVAIRNEHKKGEVICQLTLEKLKGQITLTSYKI